MDEATPSTSAYIAENDELSAGYKPKFDNTILATYKMQWALECPFIINAKYHIFVNAYKMATKSQVFKNLLKVNWTNHVTNEFFTDNLADLELAIKYCHLNEVTIDLDNLEMAYRVSHQYCIKELYEACEKYIEANLTPSIYWVFHDMVRRYSPIENDRMINTYELRVKLNKYIRCKFVEATASDNFTLVNINDLTTMLSDDCLNVPFEHELIDILGRWIDFDSATRTSFIGQLMNCVRLGLLTLKKIESLWKNHRATGNDSTDCLTSIRQARRNVIRTKRNLRPLDKCGSLPIGDSKATICRLFQKELKKSRNNNNNTLVRGVFYFDIRPRLPHEAIFVFGGWENGGASQTVRIYNNRAKDWVVHESDSDNPIVLPRPLMSFGIALYKNTQLYILGGEARTQKATQEVICYDFIKKKWLQRAPMHEVRRDLVAVNLNDEEIYAIGGDNNKTVLDCVEKLIPGRNQWVEVAPMILMRSAPAAEALGGFIYVLGGYTESQMEALTSSCEMYDPKMDQWTFIKSMSQQRYYFNALVHDDYLYVVGGGDENQGSSVERYSPDNDIWCQMPPMLQQRADFAASILEGEFYCLGGGGDSFCTAEVEFWQPNGVKPKNNEETSSLSNDENGESLAETNILNIDLDNTQPQNLPNFTPLPWKRGVSMPSPTWGHRSITIKGIDFILPYINATPQSAKPCRSRRNSARQRNNNPNTGGCNISNLYPVRNRITNDQIEQMMDDL